MPNANPSSAIASAVENVSDSSWAPPSRTRGARLYSRATTVARVAPGDPAVRVVTDFAQDEPRTISPAQCIEDALREMVCAAVRALLVVQNDMVIGLITSYDIEGRRPSEIMRDYLARREMEVQHVMTPCDRLVTLEWRVVCAAKASQIEAYFRTTRATHILIIEHVGYLVPYVRGLISRGRVTREMKCTL